MSAPYQSYPSLNMLRDDLALLRGQVDQLAQEVRALQQELALARADLERVKNLHVQTARQLATEERQRRTADAHRDRQFRALIDHLFQAARAFFARQETDPDQ
jgi:hypothetical protein